MSSPLPSPRPDDATLEPARRAAERRKSQRMIRAQTGWAQAAAAPSPSPAAAAPAPAMASFSGGVARFALSLSGLGTAAAPPPPPNDDEASTATPRSRANSKKKVSSDRGVAEASASTPPQHPQNSSSGGIGEERSDGSEKSFSPPPKQRPSIFADLGGHMDAKREDAPQRAADLWTHTAPAEGSATQGIMASMSKSRGPRGGVGSKRIESVRRSNSFDEASAPDVARLSLSQPSVSQSGTRASESVSRASAPREGSKRGGGHREESTRVRANTGGGGMSYQRPSKTNWDCLMIVKRGQLLVRAGNDPVAVRVVSGGVFGLGAVLLRQRHKVVVTSARDSTEVLYLPGAAIRAQIATNSEATTQLELGLWCMYAKQLALQVLDGVSHYRGLKLNRELGNYVERGYLHEFPECNRVIKLRHPAILIHGSAIVQQGSVNEELPAPVFLQTGECVTVKPPPAADSPPHEEAQEAKTARGLGLDDKDQAFRAAHEPVESSHRAWLLALPELHYDKWQWEYSSKTKSVEFKSRRCVSVDLQAGVRVLPATRTIKSAYEKVRNVKGLMSRIAAQGALAAARTNSDGQPGDRASGENSWGRGGAAPGRRTDKGALMRTMSSSGGLLVRKSTGGVSRCVPSMIDRSTRDSLTGGRKSVPDVKVPTMEHYMSMPCFGAAGDRASASESPSGDGPRLLRLGEDGRTGGLRGRPRRQRLVWRAAESDGEARVDHRGERHRRGRGARRGGGGRSASSRPSGASSLGRSSSTSAAGGSRERLPPIAQEGGSGDDGADSPRSPLQRVAEARAEPPLVSAGSSSTAAATARNPRPMRGRTDDPPTSPAVLEGPPAGPPSPVKEERRSELEEESARRLSSMQAAPSPPLEKAVSCSVHRTSGDL